MGKAIDELNEMQHIYDLKGNFSKICVQKFLFQIGLST